MGPSAQVLSGEPAIEYTKEHIECPILMTLRNRGTNYQLIAGEPLIEFP